MCHRIDGTFVGEYPSVVAAATALGISYSDISGNFNGRYKKTKCYIFEFADFSLDKVTSEQDGKVSGQLPARYSNS